MKLLSKHLPICLTSILLPLSAAAAVTVNFDDLSPGPAGSWVGVPQGYAGLQWYNFGALDASLELRADSGYRTGMVSPNNVAFNGGGRPAGITCASGFTLHSAYLTRALNLAAGLQQMHLRVQGFVGTNVTYDKTYTISNTAPALLSFDYVGVERVIFVSSPDVWFAMDNLVVTVPSPDESCTYVVSPRDQTHGLGNEVGGVNVIAQTGCEWSVSSTNDWITILSPVSNSGSGTVRYAVSATTGTRSGVIKIAGQNFTVSQSPPPEDRQTLTFDDLLPGDLIPHGYGGLRWGFWVLDGTIYNSYAPAVVSPDNVAFNAYGNPTFIRGIGDGTFDLHSAHITGRFLFPEISELRVQGFSGSTLRYDNLYTFTNNSTQPVFIEFNYLGITEVRFTPGHSLIFPMDNVTVTVRPDIDADNDGVPDDQDRCPDTPAGDAVNRSGCSIDQLVPCSGPAHGGTWRNHAKYVAAVIKVTESFRRSGLITARERSAIIQAAVQSDCGKSAQERTRWPVRRR